MILISLTLVLVGVKQRNGYKQEMLFWKELEAVSAFYVTELRYTCDEPLKIFSRYWLQTRGESVEKNLALEQLFYTCFQREDQLVKGFVVGLGATDLEGQLSHCTRYQRLFEAQYQASVATYQVQGKLQQKLWVLAGIAAFLIFL